MAETDVFAGSVGFDAATDVTDGVGVGVELGAIVDVREESSFSVEESRLGKIADFRAEIKRKS